MKISRRGAHIRMHCDVVEVTLTARMIKPLCRDIISSALGHRSSAFLSGPYNKNIALHSIVQPGQITLQIRP